MNTEELEDNIKLLDDAVEQLVVINESLGASVIPDTILENLQHVIAYMEREIRYGCHEEEDDDDEDTNLF